VSAVVLDTGALIAVERGRLDVALPLRQHLRAGGIAVVPAGCLAQAWRRPSRQARLAAFLRADGVELADLVERDARRIGLLLEAARTSDVVDGHVAVLGLRHAAVVFTSDPDDLGRLAPELAIHAV
jgi:hypothetical protein